MYRSVAAELKIAPQIAHTVPLELGRATCVHLRRTDKILNSAEGESETTPVDFERIRNNRRSTTTTTTTITPPPPPPQITYLFGFRLPCAYSLAFSATLIEASENLFFVTSDETEARQAYENDLRGLGGGKPPPPLSSCSGSWP